MAGSTHLILRELSFLEINLWYSGHFKYLGMVSLVAFVLTLPYFIGTVMAIIDKIASKNMCLGKEKSTIPGFVWHVPKALAVTI